MYFYQYMCASNSIVMNKKRKMLNFPKISIAKHPDECGLLKQNKKKKRHHNLLYPTKSGLYANSFYTRALS